MLDNCREIRVMNIPMKLCGTSCIELFTSSGSTAGAAVVPLLPSIRSSSGGTAVYRLPQAAVVPLVVPLEVPADKRSSQNTLTVPERYQCGTTAGFLCFSTKGPSGTTASTADMDIPNGYILMRIPSAYGG